MKRVLFIASTGGHLSELLKLEAMFNKYDYKLVTENTKSNKNLKNKYNGRVNYLVYGTKEYNKIIYAFKLLYNCFKSLFIYLKFHPDYIITTGTHTAGPMCCLARIFGSKVIYIETFANMYTKTATGKLVYPISNLFIVQWDSMKEIYPKAEVGGWIY